MFYIPLNSIIRNCIAHIVVLFSVENLIFIGHIFAVKLKAKDANGNRFIALCEAKYSTIANSSTLTVVPHLLSGNEKTALVPSDS